MSGSGRQRSRRHLSLGGRVRLVLALLVLPPLLAVLAALATEPAAASARHEVAKRFVPMQVTTDDLLTQMVNTENSLRGFLLSRQQTYLQGYNNGWKAAMADVRSVRATIGTDPVLTARLAAVVSQLGIWQSQAEHIRLNPSLHQVPELTQVRSSIAAFDGVVATDSAQAETRSDHLEREEAWILGITIVGSALLTALGAVVLTRWLRAPLARLEEELAHVVSHPDNAVASTTVPELASLAGRVDELRRSVLDESTQRVQRGLVVAQEDERRRIAAGLHDDIIQSLTAVALRLQVAEVDAEGPQREILDGAAAAAANAIDRLRDMVFELYPPALERHGLVAALEAYGAGLCGGPGIAFTSTGDTGQVSMTAQAIAYRVAREAIANACKHSGASSIEASVAPSDGGLAVQVHDNGGGFDRAAVPDVPGHIGLTSAEQLVAGSLGLWNLASGVGQGTTVGFWLPDPERL
jgi:two-component system, NarL family, sensor histidine kinase UhpB